MAQSAQPQSAQPQSAQPQSAQPQSAQPQSTQPQTMLDRLRIERAVWMMNTRLQDLPRRSRVTRRRELRENLRAAADDVGARQAVHQLGDLRILAADYLAAEYGDLSRRPSWTATALFILLVEVVMTLLETAGRSGFHAGVTAAAPHATGTFHWSGIPYLISEETFTYLDGTSTSTGGAWTPAVYVIMFVGAVVAGRLWRLLAAWRRARHHVPPTADHDPAHH